MILDDQPAEAEIALTCAFMVELRGVEPRTSSMRTKRATNCATAPSASSGYPAGSVVDGPAVLEDLVEQPNLRLDVLVEDLAAGCGRLRRYRCRCRGWRPGPPLRRAWLHRVGRRRNRDRLPLAASLRRQLVP